MKIPAAVFSIPTVKPTYYRLTEFRSRTEARWAVVFDHSNMPWVYEPQGFFLPSGDVYIPDFWLPDWRMFAEVKPDGGDFGKALELAKSAPVLLLEGSPEAMAYAVVGGEDTSGCWSFSDDAIRAGRSAKFEELISQHTRRTSYY